MKKNSNGLPGDFYEIALGLYGNQKQDQAYKAYCKAYCKRPSKFGMVSFNFGWRFGKVINRIKRRLYANPVLSTDGNYYIFAWQWPDGVLEIAKEGVIKPGQEIKIPCRISRKKLIIVRSV